MKTPMHLPIRFLHKDKENTAMSFENTQYARDYFQCQVPTIIRTLKQIAANQEKQIELQQQALQAIVMPQKVFVCREENSAALYSDAGNINQLFVTTSPWRSNLMGTEGTLYCEKKRLPSIHTRR